MMSEFIKAKDGNKNSVLYYTASDKVIERTGGTRAWRNNNPGNLRNSAFSKTHGSVGEAGGFAVFPDEETGRQALKDLLKTKTYRQLDIGKAITRYAPPVENDTGQYIKNIESMTELPASKSMDHLNDQELEKVVDAIRRIEGWREGKVSEQKKAKTIWVHSGGECDVCAAMKGTVYESDPGDVTMHPNCRCTAIKKEVPVEN